MSKGPELVIVPPVRGSAVDVARTALKNAGFKVKVEYRSRFLFRVTNSDPAEGTQAPKGSTVTIFVV
ncbi:MAG: PASTA domain-containing protein [Propionicimonas sp.]